MTGRINPSSSLGQPPQDDKNVSRTLIRIAEVIETIAPMITKNMSFINDLLKDRIQLEKPGRSSSQRIAVNKSAIAVFNQSNKDPRYTEALTKAKRGSF